MCKTQIAVIFGTPFVSIWGHPTKSHTKTTPKTNRTAMNCHELPLRMANLRFPNYQPLALLMNFIRKYPEKTHRKLSSATSGPSNTWHNWANKKLTNLYTFHSISSNFNVFVMQILQVCPLFWHHFWIFATWSSPTTFPTTCTPVPNICSNTRHVPRIWIETMLWPFFDASSQGPKNHLNKGSKAPHTNLFQEHHVLAEFRSPIRVSGGWQLRVTTHANGHLKLLHRFFSAGNSMISMCLKKMKKHICFWSMDFT